MAKFGEGDARWIVTERADGANVNGWHWVEKDVMEWCKARLPELLVGKPLVDSSSGMELSISGLDTMTGEAIINNRKQKIIPSYELEIALAWQGSAQGTACKGKLHLPYIADENHDEEPEMRFACEAEDAPSLALKAAFLQGPGKQTVASLVKQFVAELRAGGPSSSSTAASNPAASSSSAASKPKLTSADPDQVRAPVNGSGSPAPAPASKPKAGSGKAGPKSSLSLTEHFVCRASDVWECLMVDSRFKAWTQSNASIDAKAGGKFMWFGGSVQGEFVEVEPCKRVVMNWRFSSWVDGCVSKVVLELSEPEPGHTVVTMHQTGIPEVDQFGSEEVLQTTEKGWRVQIFQRIRHVFGYGLGL